MSEKIKNFATGKVSFHCYRSHSLTQRSPDLHAMQTINNLASLLVAPINAYQSVLILLALPRYTALLSLQPFTTRRSLAHAIVGSALKNETVIETPEDVRGVLDLCGVMVRDPNETSATGGAVRRPPYPGDREEMAEEQGWMARMVHLFRTDDLDVQFEVCFVLVAWPLILTECILSCTKRQGDISSGVESGYGMLTRHLSRMPSNYVEGTSFENKRSVSEIR